MTASKYVTIWCDDGYDPATGTRPCHQRFEEPMDPTATGARKAAREVGWTYIAGHPTTGPGRDLCPMHAAGGDPR